MEEKTPTVEKQEDAAELRQERDELLTKLKYLQAEFENYRKRVERDMETVVKYAHEALIARLLPVLDEMDVAVKSLKGREGDGVRMVRENFLKTLKEAGLQEIPAEGLMFDPYVMDCIQQVPDPNMQEGVVKEVVLKGYRLHDRVLRPAHVVVVRNRGEPDG
jgi:molecular chaperone GrpE